MGTALGERIIECPAYASVDTAGDVTALRIRAVFARWVKWGFAGGVVLFIGCIVCISVLVQICDKGPDVPPVWIILSFIGCGLVLLFLYALGISCLIVSSNPGELICDGKKVRIRDRGGCLEIPVDEIRGIRQVIYPSRRLEIDVDGPPSHFFFIGRKSAMEIAVPDGRIDVFRQWEEWKVAWMAAEAHRVLFPGAATPEAVELREGQDPNVISSGGLYGPVRRVLLWAGIVIGVVATSISGWYAYEGLSSRHWPGVAGRVIHSVCEEQLNSKNEKVWNAEIRYEYKVNGVRYENDRFGYGRAPGDEIVKGFVAAHPDGSATDVYCDAENPGRSVVIRGLGALHWVVVGLSVTPFILVSPLFFFRTTQAQDSLNARYKSQVDRHKQQAMQATATIRWSMPEDVWRTARRESKRGQVVTAVRVPAIIALVLWATHHWVAPVLPPDLPWGWITFLVMAYTGIFSLVYFAQIFFYRKEPPKYAINSDGILVPSQKHPRIRWKFIASFVVRSDEQEPPHRVLVIYRTDAPPRHISLPGGGLDEAILSALRAKVPEGPPPRKYATVTRRDWIIGFVLIALVAWAQNAYIVAHWHQLRHSDFVDYVRLIELLAGPGTWMAVALWRRRSKTQLVMLAAGINLVFLMVAMVALVLQLGWHVLRQ
jgi:hypothetical protein